MFVSDRRRLKPGRTVTWLLALGLFAAAPKIALAAPDARELQAREDFVAGRYEAALELYARLYAETLHPNYLRNIGRCYQNLGQPDRAITSFRDYLRKAKDVTPDEHAEIEGYIKEMQDLKKQREASGAGAVAPASSAAATAPATSAGATSAAATATATTLPTAAPPPDLRANAPAANAVVLTAPPPPAESPPLYARWWFWAIVAGVVAAGVGVAAATGTLTHTTDASCPKGYQCAP
jgi:hypothetical protein